MLSWWCHRPEEIPRSQVGITQRFCVSADFLKKSRRILCCVTCLLSVLKHRKSCLVGQLASHHYSDVTYVQFTKMICILSLLINVLHWE